MIDLEVLEPESCDGCGLCCEGIFSPPAMYLLRTSRVGGFLFRPKNFPESLARQIEDHFDRLAQGADPLPHCLWFDPESRQCRHHEWRPSVCRNYPIGGEACLRERQSFLQGRHRPAPPVIDFG
jgi:Fe-S-cluster containining protein